MMVKRFANWLFKKFCNPEYYPDIQGDLEEIHNNLVQHNPRWLASLLYLKEIFLLFRLSLLKPNEYLKGLFPRAILANYFIVAFRQLTRHRVHSFINISGLTIGLSCCLIISIYIMDELSYEQFFKNHESIYRINSHSEIGGNERFWSLAPSSVGTALNENLPEIENYTRIATLSKSQQLITYQDKIFDGSVNGGPYGRVFWADSNFLDIFTYKSFTGDLAKALDRPDAVVITRKVADKIFADEPAMGKILEFSNLGNFEVTGIIDRVPANSHLQFDYLLSHNFAPLPPPQGLFWARVYISLNPKANIDHLQAKIDSVGSKAEANLIKNGVNMSYRAVPIGEIHLTSGLEYEVYPTNDIRYIYIFSAISLFILVIASINFVNLSTAQLAKRAREVGVRKVMGAGRNQMIIQFFIQSLSVTVLSAVLSIIIVYLSLDGFNQFAEKSLTLKVLFQLETFVVILIITIGIGLIAGLYPALVMSAFSPVNALKDNVKPHSASQWLRKVLVVFQFSISVILITATLIVIRQLYFLKNQDLGFDQDQILVINIDRNQSYNELKVLKNRMLNLSAVDEATLSSGAPGRHTNVMVMRPDGFDASNSHRMDGIYGDYDFVKTYGLKLMAGRDFDQDLPSDSLNFILNYSAIRKIGWSVDSAIQRNLDYPGNSPSGVPAKGGKIIGVTEDFHYQSLHNEIGALMISVHSSNFPLLGLNHLSLKIKTSDLGHALTSIEKIWDEVNPGKPFDYAFLDTHFEKQYMAEERISQIISAFAFLGIMIACLGLFGLALFVTQQRTKEIGIRKVLGASITQIVSRLSSGFIILVVIGNFIAWPVSYYFLQNWLEGFAYHIEISWMIFLTAGLSSIAIALFTIGYQTLKAAVANPVNSLRYE